MKFFHSRSASSAEEQASLWAARLDGGNLTAADRAALDAWLAANPAHRPLLSRYCQFSTDLEENLLALVATGAVNLPPEQESKPARRHWSLPWFAGAASAAAAAVVFVFWLARPGAQFESIETPAAHRRSLTLADGSRVELNARTSLRVENSRTERRVQLATGEAYFVVSKDRQRPFIVETPAGSVRVTGTIFNVRSETTSQLEVTVVQGSVQVSPGLTGGPLASTPVTLGAGDRLSASPGGVAFDTLSRSALEDAFAWRRGQIVCNGTPLAEVAARFAHYHGRKIMVAPDAAGLRVGGQYSLDDLEGFFTALQNNLFSGKSVGVTVDPASGTAQVRLRSDR
ncbi:MAG TPA: FecR domain-containing protein [Opitutaceae bacterium]|nr:FecR domain-containing protein [Opitutaceae bacterium]